MRRELGVGLVQDPAKREQKLAIHADIAAQAACHLIAGVGFEGLRTRNVAARAGVNIATLHYYFPSKEDLIRGVVEYLLQQFMMAYLPGSPFEMKTPLEQLRGELAELQYLVQEKPTMFIILDELILRSLHDSAINEMIKWLDESWQTYLEHVIRNGIEQGQFRADLDPGYAATWLILFIKGTTLHYMTNPAAIDFDRIKTDIELWFTGQYWKHPGEWQLNRNRPIQHRRYLSHLLHRPPRHEPDHCRPIKKLPTSQGSL